MDHPFSRREKVSAGAYGFAILALNAYVCRELFFNQTAWMNSMHGFWIAIAEHAGNRWFHESWWPYWDGGIPFEFTYAPLVPALTGLWANLRGIPPALAFNVITGALFCLTPCTLFLAVWVLTRRPGYSFATAVFYSFTAPTQWIAPDASFRWAGIWDTRRLYTMAVWDEAPHMAALALLPLIVLFLALAMRTRRHLFIAGSVGFIALASLASAFGPVDTALAAICLVFAVRHNNPGRRLRDDLLLVAGIGIFAWCLCASYYSPALIRSIIAATGTHGEGRWDLGSLLALVIAAAGAYLLFRAVRRYTSDWRPAFAALFGFLICSEPVLAAYFHHQFLPQPTRYKMEMELVLAPIVVFAAGIWIEKLPRWGKVAIILAAAALAGKQVIVNREFAKSVLRPADPAQTVEYRAAIWAAKNLPGERVMLPGSVSAWANMFTDVQQFGGGSWSMAANMAQVRGLYAIYNGGAVDFNEPPQRDAATALLWLRAFGATAVGVSAPDSQEYYKPFAHPGKFDGMLPLLWSDAGVAIYRVPSHSTSLAHIIPESSLVTRTPADPGDVEPLRPYVAAIDDPASPHVDFAWVGTDQIRIQTHGPALEALSIQVSYSPGWHATIDGKARDIEKDGLGLMWLRPQCSGPCEVQLRYDGGWELRICRWISLIAFVALLLWFGNSLVRAAVTRARDAARP